MAKKYPLDNLIKALVLIDNEEDCKKLLDDICTINLSLRVRCRKFVML